LHIATGEPRKKGQRERNKRRENKENAAKACTLQHKEHMVGRDPGEVPETFDIGEKVWLDSQNLQLRTNSIKLTDRHLGPFKVSEKLSDRAYWLELPENLKIHNIFHVGLLSKVKEDKSRPILGEPGPLVS
jgi:hypothetical protein